MTTDDALWSADGAEAAFTGARQDGDPITTAYFVVRLSVNGRAWADAYGEEREPADLVDAVTHDLACSVPPHLQRAVLLELRQVANR